MRKRKKKNQPSWDPSQWKLNFIEKKNKSTISQWGWKQSPQTWISADIIIQTGVLRERRYSQSWGDWNRVSWKIHRYTELIVPWQYLSLSSHANALKTEVVKAFHFIFYFTLWTFKLTSLSTDTWIIVRTYDIYSVFFITECYN